MNKETRENRKKEIAKKFNESKKRFANYKFNYIYFLQIEAKFYIGHGYNAEIANEFNYSEVYSSLEDAKNEGQSILNDKLDYFIKDNNAQYEEDRVKNIKELIKEDTISYYMSITKVDPYYRDNFFGPNKEEDNIGLIPTSITYSFDFEGNMKGKYSADYNCTDYAQGYSAFISDDDLKEGRGIKFKYGDIVHDNRFDNNYMIIKHWADTLPQGRRELWMNKYWGVCINNDGSLNDYNDDLFESDLTIVTKAENVAKNSPWAFIQELFRNQDRVKDNYWDKFWNGEINFKESKSWRDVTIEDIINMEG